MIEQLSIDLTNYCTKQCPFCYNHSQKEGATLWSPDEVIAFASDCTNHGVKAISLGGGEPFEYDGIFEIIHKLYPLCYLTITTNGLPLNNERIWKQLAHSHPDKIHITIHYPESKHEVQRVIGQIQQLTSIGIKSGVNLLVDAEKLEETKAVYEQLLDYLLPEQIILVPRRYAYTPTPRDLAHITSRRAFQSPSCLLKCEKPLHFASVSWDKKVNFCSFAPDKHPLLELTFHGLLEALSRIRFRKCY